jgi:hypothetical protein
LTPGALMLLTAHWVREGWLQVDISSSGGSLIATAYALCDLVHLCEAPMRPLGSLIVLRTQLNRAATEKFQDSFSDRLWEHDMVYGSDTAPMLFSSQLWFQGMSCYLLVSYMHLLMLPIGCCRPLEGRVSVTVYLVGWWSDLIPNWSLFMILSVALFLWPCSYSVYSI